jgi:hypothetical protein
MYPTKYYAYFIFTLILALSYNVFAMETSLLERNKNFNKTSDFHRKW